MARTNPFGFDSEATPTKTIKPVNTGPVAPTQQSAAPKPFGVSWADYANGLGQAAGFSDSSALSTGFGAGRPKKILDELGGLIGFGGPATMETQYGASGMNEGGETSYTANGYKANPELLAALQNYRINPTSEFGADLYDPSGKRVGGFTNGDKPSWFDNFAEKAIPVGLAALAGGAALGSFGPGATGAGIGASGAGAAGDIGFLAANGMTDATIASASPGLASAGGLTGVGGTLGAAGAAGGFDPGSGSDMLASAGADAGGPGIAEGQGVISGGSGLQAPSAGLSTAAPAAPAAAGGGGVMQSLGLGGLGTALSNLGSGVSDFATNNPLIGKVLGGAGAALGAGLATKALAGSAPTTPSAAEMTATQSAANADAAKLSAQLNRVDTTTPFGFQKFGQVADPSVPGGIRYTQEIGLSPEQQALYNAETSNQLSSQNIAKSMQDRVAASVANPLDLGAAGQAEKAMSGDAFSADRDKVTQALFDRLTALRKPQMDRDRSALDVQLRNQGLMPGTEAYDNGMRSMLEAQNTELSDAADRAILAGGTEQSRLQSDARANAGLNNQVRSQGIQELLLQRQQPLTEFNSFRTGNTPTLPQFQPFGFSSVAPVNTTANTQQQYQSQADAYNARIAQLQSLLNFGVQAGKG